MKNELSEAAKYLSRKRRRQIWRRAVVCLACVVVFVTTYALILPALTLEKPVCGLTEHTHAKECYEEEAPVTKKEILCSRETLGTHTHTAGCYDKNGSLTCGYGDYVVHTHDGNCYGQDGNLLCTLQEVKAHVHTGDCYDSDGKVVCGKLQGEAHTHSAACYTDGALTCGKLQVQAHQHTDACFRITEQAAEKKLVCGLEEHTHTDACYPKKETEKPGETETAGVKETETSGEKTAETEGESAAETSGEAITEKGQTESETENAEKTDAAGGRRARTGESAGQTRNAPINCEPYISEMKIYYKETAEADWKLLEGETQIPGDAELRLEINFSNVKTSELRDSDGQLVYSLPNVFRGADTVGELQDSNKNPIGTMTVQENSVALDLDDGWLDKQRETVEGTFYVEGKLNLTEINQQGNQGSVVIGNLNINVDMEGDWVSRYSTLELEKTIKNADGKEYPVEHTEEGDFLTYTLTATAGPDGIDNAAVVDKFTSTAQVQEYCDITTEAQTAAALSSVQEGITSTAAAPAAGTVYYAAATEENPVPEAGGASSKPGNLVWHIGKMEPNETRTLTYKVKLIDGYSSHKQTATITNTASAYSDTYLRDTAVDHFTPSAEGYVKKHHETYGTAPNQLDFEPDADGVGGTITYIILVRANADNNYPLDMKLYDFFAEGLHNHSIINPDYISLVEDSFQLYEGEATTLAGTQSLALRNGTLVKDENYNGSYVYHVGTMEPGEARTLVYKVKIADSEFLKSGEALQLTNRVRAFAENDNTGVGNSGGVPVLESYSDTLTVQNYKWSEKLVGAELENSTTVSMDAGDDVYTYDGGSADEAPRSFTVPAHSFQYVVKVNEAGALTVNSTTMKDTMGEHLVYSGYLKVEAFQKTGTPEGAEIYAPIDYDTQSPVRTVWMDVDDRSSFAFSPAELGFGEEEAYAYRLTYYARPKNVSSIVTVTNDFYLTGVVGGKYQLAGIRNQVVVTVTGSSRFSTSKSDWYYEKPVEGASATWAKGALYWYIKASGSSVPAGTILRDRAGVNNSIKENSCLAGVYRGVLPEDAADVSALENLTPLPADAYTYNVITEGNGTLEVTFPEEIPLNEEEGEAVYVIVRTSPEKLPSSKGSVQVYENQLLFGTGDGDFSEQNTATKTLYGSEGVSKTWKGMFTYDGTEWKHRAGTHNSISYIDTTNVTEPGIYLDWLIDVNYFGNLEGEVELEDILPEGVEPVYVRYYSKGGSVSLNNISIPEIPGMDESRKHTWAGRGGGPLCTYYYDEETGSVRWKVAGLDRQTEEVIYNKKTVEFQILCRVTDSDVLMGEETKVFNNTVIGMQDGQEIGKDSDRTSVSREPASLDKQGGLAAAASTGRIPFSIKVNPLGEDLVPDSDTIKLVDELSDSLSIDLTTLHVRRSVEENPEHPELLAPSQYTPRLEGNVFSIELPDGMPLTVTYEATVSAAPGEPVNIGNTAHWEGYEASDDSVVTQSNFAYSVGGQMASPNAQFSLLKVDSANLNHPLKGARFTIQAYGVNRTDTEVTLGEAQGSAVEGVTNDAGALVFGEGTEHLVIEYDTVYCVKEIEAPEGYVLDTEPHYFVVAKEAQNSQYLSYPQNVDIQYAGVSSEYKYVAQNSRGRIPVEKKFQDGNGKEKEVIPGIYTFGVYETDGTATPSGETLQTLTVTYETDGTKSFLRDGVPATTMTFKDLPLDKTYAVYELDGDGKPIAGEGRMWLAGKLFAVSYSGNTGITFKQDTGEPETSPTVTNTLMEAYELPESGGHGILMYILSGTAILAGALYYILRKRREAV